MKEKDLRDQLQEARNELKYIIENKAFLKALFDNDIKSDEHKERYERILQIMGKTS